MKLPLEPPLYLFPSPPQLPGTVWHPCTPLKPCTFQAFCMPIGSVCGCYCHVHGFLGDFWKQNAGVHRTLARSSRAQSTMARNKEQNFNRWTDWIVLVGAAFPSLIQEAAVVWISSIAQASSVEDRWEPSASASPAGLPHTSWTWFDSFMGVVALCSANKYTLSNLLVPRAMLERTRNCLLFIWV